MKWLYRFQEQPELLAMENLTPGLMMLSLPILKTFFFAQIKNKEFHKNKFEAVYNEIKPVNWKPLKFPRAF